MYLDKEDQEITANVLLHATILLWSVAEDIEEDHPERAQQLKDLNGACGDLFNFFNPKEGIKLEVELGDSENEIHH
jgi:hypothetical protein